MRVEKDLGHVHAHVHVRCVRFPTSGLRGVSPSRRSVGVQRTVTGQLAWGTSRDVRSRERSALRRAGLDACELRRALMLPIGSLSLRVRARFGDEHREVDEVCSILVHVLVWCKASFAPCPWCAVTLPPCLCAVAGPVESGGSALSSALPLGRVWLVRSRREPARPGTPRGGPVSVRSAERRRAPPESCLLCVLTHGRSRGPSTASLEF